MAPELGENGNAAILPDRHTVLGHSQFAFVNTGGLGGMHKHPITFATLLLTAKCWRLVGGREEIFRKQPCRSYFKLLFYRFDFIYYLFIYLSL